MWRSLWSLGKESQGSTDRFARLLAVLTVVCLGAAFVVSNGTQFLMPGRLTSAHGAIKNCAACHTSSGSGKLSWIQGLMAGSPLADSKACLTCHKMPATAFFPHGASAGVLIESTKRLTKIAATTPAPLSARIQSKAFPSHDVVARGVICNTCHQEHRGDNFNLKKISNEQCRSCHMLKFNSFEHDHPQFGNYPFDRRTRIVYDHAAHFDKHFPQVLKKDPARHIPTACSTCHNSREDRRIMTVAPFEQTCSGCHLNQIMGKERASGPRGIAFLTLPGLDLQTLEKKNVSIGEWPDASEAELTPFMKVMISRSEKGRTLIKTVGELDLKDLSKASDEQLTAVKDLAWEIKRQFFALIAKKASDTWGNLKIDGDAKLSATLVADLTASIPRDVIFSAQQQWLPNLAREMGVGPNVAVQQPAQSDREPSGSSATAPEEPTPADTREAPALGQQSDDGEAARQVQHDPPACLMRVFGQCLMSSGPSDKGDQVQPKKSGGDADAAKAKTDGSQKKSSAAELPPPMRAGLKDAGQIVELAETSAAKQSDDLLFPTEEELREIKAHNKDNRWGSTDAPAKPAMKSDTVSPAPQTSGSSVTSDADSESWAEYGGWYRQDYTIFYRPVGHKDKFIYSWLLLTGPHAPEGGKSPATQVFDTLTGKDAQGSCTKCHSVDDVPGKGRVVNFSPLSVESKRGRFTNFIHEPHFTSMGTRGCLTCHGLEKDRPYLKGYEQGNPRNFVSNFATVKKDLCQSCHGSSAARQDCLTCHKYHVNDVITPIMDTKLPIK